MWQIINNICWEAGMLAFMWQKTLSHTKNCTVDHLSHKMCQILWQHMWSPISHWALCACISVHNCCLRSLLIHLTLNCWEIICCAIYTIKYICHIKIAPVNPAYLTGAMGNSEFCFPQCLRERKVTVFPGTTHKVLVKIFYYTSWSTLWTDCTSAS